MERTGMSPVRASLSSMEIKDKSMPTYSRLQKPVLVLNASYEPINICAARRALILVLKGIASAEELSQHSVHSTRLVAQEHSYARPLHLSVLPQSHAGR